MMINQYPIGSRTINPNSDFILGIVTGQLADIPWNSVLTTISPATFGVLMLTWFNSLPTTLPGTPGVLWNNSGTLAQS